MHTSRSQRKRRGFWVLATAVAFTVGCAPQAPIEPRTSKDPETHARRRSRAAEKPDLDLPAPPPSGSVEPVPRPEDIFITVRIGKPSDDLRSLRPFFGPSHEAARAIFGNPEQAASTLFGSLGPFLDLEAPIHLVGFDPQSSRPLVMSIVLRDYAEATRAASRDFRFRPDEDGRIVVLPKSAAKSSLGMTKAGYSCAIFRGGAPVKDHFVCAQERSALDIVGPYLARTVSHEKTKPGLSIQIASRMINHSIEKVSAEIEAKPNRMSLSTAGQAGWRFGQKLGLDWLRDFQEISLDATFQPRGLRASLTLRFRSLASPLSVAMVGAGRPHEPVRKELFQVPADADFAFYFPGAKPETIRPVADAFWKQVESIEIGNHTEMSVWKELIAKFQKSPLLKGGPSLVAHGPAMSMSGLPKDVDSKGELYFMSRAFSSDWFLFASFEPVSTWANAIREQLKKPSFFPKRTLDELGRTIEAPHESSMHGYEEIAIKPADKLPAGSLHLVRATMPNPAFKPTTKTPALDGPYDTHLFLAGTKDISWIVISHNEPLARRKLLEAMSKSGGIGSRPDLDPLHAMPAGGIGFATLKGIAALFGENEDTLGGLLANIRTQRTYSAIGSGGDSPIFCSFVSASEPQSQATLRMDMDLEDAALRALFEWALKRDEDGPN